MREGVQLSVAWNLGEVLRERWTKYIVASVLIHAAALSIPFPSMVPRMAGPIEVFILEGTGASAPSGAIVKQDRPPMRSPLSREEAVIRPQEPARPVETKTEQVQQAIENITVLPTAARNDSAALKSGAAAGGGREEKAPVSGRAAGIASGSGGGGAGAGDTDAGFGTPSGPRFLYREIPEYPFLARRRKIEGKVVLAVFIDAAGKLTKVEVIEASDRTFADASLEALKKSTFLPARRNGRPVASRAILPIRFTLTD